jgi:drug/metabolite transporter superfamily protein YnfA
LDSVIEHQARDGGSASAGVDDNAHYCRSVQMTSGTSPVYSHSMQWWQDFPGWVTTTVLAAVAAVTGAWAIWRYRRDRPQVEWVEQRVATASAFFVTLTNVGDAAAIYARAMGVGCTIVASADNEVIFYRIEPGTGQQITVNIDAVPEDAVGMTAQDMLNRATVRMTYLTAPVKHRSRHAVTVQLVNGEIHVEKLPARNRSA